MAIMISVGVTVEKRSLLVNLYLHIFDSVLSLFVRMWQIRQTRALQGQRSDVN